MQQLERQQRRPTVMTRLVHRGHVAGGILCCYGWWYGVSCVETLAKLPNRRIVCFDPVGNTVPQSNKQSTKPTASNEINGTRPCFQHWDAGGCAETGNGTTAGWTTHHNQMICKKKSGSDLDLEPDPRGVWHTDT